MAIYILIFICIFHCRPFSPLPKPRFCNSFHFPNETQDPFDFEGRTKALQDQPPPMALLVETENIKCKLLAKLFTFNKFAFQQEGGMGCPLSYLDCTAQQKQQYGSGTQCLGVVCTLLLHLPQCCSGLLRQCHCIEEVRKVLLLLLYSPFSLVAMNLLQTRGPTGKWSVELWKKMAESSARLSSTQVTIVRVSIRLLSEVDFGMHPPPSIHSAEPRKDFSYSLLEELTDRCHCSLTQSLASSTLNAQETVNVEL